MSDREIPKSMLEPDIGQTNDEKKMRMLDEISMGPIREFDLHSNDLITFLTIHGNQPFIVKRVGEVVQIWTIDSLSADR